MHVIKNLPDWAESHFSVLCDEKNVIRNKSSQDRAGWDYIVEFDEPINACLPLDQQHGSTTCRVQIKSKNAGSPRTELKLSNALRFCREPDPCFILLVLYSKNSGAISYYVREFDEDLMAQSLKRAREADRDGISDLHKIRIPIRFHPEDLAFDPIEILRLRSAGSGADYAVKKANLNKTLGYTAPYVIGSITLAASQVQPFIDHGAGLPSNFEVERVRFNDHRFGIAAHKPIFEGKPVDLKFQAPPKPASLRVKGANGHYAAFEGEFRAFNLPGLPLDNFRASFKSNVLSSVISGKSEMTLEYNILTNTPRTLAELQNLVSFRLAIRSSLSIILEVERHSISGTGNANIEENDSEWIDWFNEVLTCLQEITRCNEKPILCFDDLGFNSEGVANFVGALSNNDIIVNLDFIDILPNGFEVRNLVYLICIELGDSTFSAIVKRPCLQQEIQNKHLTLTFGGPILLEHAARRGPATRHLPALKKRFNNWKTRLGDGLLQIQDGNLFTSENSICLF